MKLGRIKKNSKKNGKHNKYNRDNIIRRFKVYFMRNIYNYINSCFQINQRLNNDKNINLIKKLSSNETKLISKIDNINWLNTPIKNIFSKKISPRILTVHSDYNKGFIK